ncbi:hypothetical protein LJR045_000972 [Microbacterium sp. LjRoot45]|uniref:hypothetical protein n=1 Tax=Microbacterium sp. LjRoot45 TaxID=3342329 RepID=UPI003ED1721A
MTKRMIGSPFDIAPDPERSAEVLRRREFERHIAPPIPVDGPEHVIYGGRQEGKTWLATRWLDATPRGRRRILVTLNADMAREVNDAAFPYGEAEAISYRQLQNRGAEEGVEYGFDDVAQLLAEVFKLHEPPRLVTICTAAPWQGEEPESEEAEEAPALKVALGVDQLVRELVGGEPAAPPAEEEPLLRYFTHTHLPEGPLAETSRLFAVVARQLVETLPRSPERTVALRKLLESKDAAVRTALDVGA